MYSRTACRQKETGEGLAVSTKADSNRREPLPAQTSEAAVGGTPRWSPSRSVRVWPAARRDDPPHRHHAQGSMSNLYATLEKLAAMGNPGPMRSKNFLATPQLDIDLWTELLCTLCRENYPSRRVYRNRAIFESAYHC